MSSGTSSIGSGSGTRTTITSPGFTACLALGMAPFSVTCPSSIKAWMRDRESPISGRPARKTSMRG